MISGASVTLIPPPRRSAPASSQVPIAIAAAAMPMNTCRAVSSDTTIAAPSTMPTVIAAGRFRPARDTLATTAARSAGAGAAPATGAALARAVPRPTVPGPTGPPWTRAPAPTRRASPARTALRAAAGLFADVHRRTAGVDGFVVYSVREDDPHFLAVLERPVPTVVCDQPAGVEGVDVGDAGVEVVRLVRRDLRIRVGEREDDRPVGHLGDHLARDGARHGEACFSSYAGQVQCRADGTGYLTCNGTSWAEAACPSGRCKRTGEVVLCE